MSVFEKFNNDRAIKVQIWEIWLNIEQKRAQLFKKKETSHFKVRFPIQINSLETCKWLKFNILL
jgi:hypothetical protein